MKIIIMILFIGVAGGFFLLNNHADNEKSVEILSDYKEITYNIEGQRVNLKTAKVESETATDSASKSLTQYFGNELIMDLDNDGLEDIAFIVTQTSGGSGTFYYAVAALKTEEGYVGTEGYLLGDRIAPQSVDLSPNPVHKNVVVFNYMERELDEPMTTQPSVGKSVYLKIVPETLQWAIVEPDFEGESIYEGDRNQ